MAVRLGVNPIVWSNDDLRILGGDTPLETCLREAREAGYEGIELGHKFPRTPDALAPVLAQHGLSLVSGWYSSALLQRDAAAEMVAMRPHLDLLKALGCEVLILCECTGAVHSDRGLPLSGRPVLPTGDWPRFARRLTQLAEAMTAQGMALAYHHHMGTVVQTAAEVDRLMAETGPAVKLLLDTGHLTFAGADPLAVARRYRDRIVHVHLKDVRDPVMREALRHDWSFLDAVVAGVFTVPGDGAVDFASVLGALPGYHGWLVVEAEQDPVKAPPLAYARMGAANLRRLASAAGLRPSR